MRINDNFQLLRNNYLFTEINMRTAAYEKANPDKKVLRLGVGDVSRPLPKVILDALHHAVDELADSKTFRGYGPEDGYSFLKQAIIQNDYKPLGIPLTEEEVFINDGAGSDLGNLCDILGRDNRVAVLDPVYPAYVDSNIMAGRAGEWLNDHWSAIEYMPCTAENGFVPDLPKQRCDIIYLCFPNNPTGTTLRREEMQNLVDYTLRNRSLIIFDAAYKAFIEEDGIPYSIYECEGAKEVAIEICSYSKTAGFTGVRCGYTIVPKELKGRNERGEKVALTPLWFRRQCTKYNGTSYIAQRAAEATYTMAGQSGIMENIQYYKRNAKTIREGLQQLGYACYGGINSPYIWLKTPHGEGSWEFFDKVLNECQVVCTPGVGFGRSGERYVRMSAFGTHEVTTEAVKRLQRL